MDGDIVGSANSDVTSLLVLRVGEIDDAMAGENAPKGECLSLNFCLILMVNCFGGKIGDCESH